MNVVVTDINDLRKELVVSLDASEVAHEEGAIINQFQKQARVPGFRQGKAPATLIRKRFKDALNEELGKKLAAKAFQDAIKEKSLEVHNIVDFKGAEDIVPGQDVTLDITVDLKPTFELPEYKGIATEVPGIDVSDEDVDNAIEHIRRQRADFKEVDRAAAASDYVKLSYSGTVDGTPISELIEDAPAHKSWAGVENGWEEAGTDEAKQFGVPAIIDGVVGMSKGEEKTVTFDFADDFKIEALRGKTGTYQLTVHEVRERVLPEMDEAFLKSLQVESVEDLKARMLDDLEGRKKNEQRAAQRRQVSEFLLSAVDFPLPESAVESETQQVMGRIMMENMQRGVAEEEFEKHKEELHAQASQTARNDVKMHFILGKIAEKESIEVKQEDIQRAIMSIAMQNRQKPEDIVKELKKDQQQVAGLQRQILLGKTLDFLIKEATLTVVAETE